MDKILYITKTFSHRAPGRTSKYEKFFAFLLARGLRIRLLTSMEPGTADYSSWKARGLDIKFVWYPVYLLKNYVFDRNVGQEKKSSGTPERETAGPGQSGPGTSVTGLLRKKIFPGSGHYADCVVCSFLKNVRFTFFRKKTFLVPDHYADWMLFTLPAAFCAVRKEKVKLVITACFPYSAHFIGLLLKRFTGIHWIAEFRDPWASNPLWERTDLVQAASRVLEKWTVKYADRIVLYKGWFPGGAGYFLDKYQVSPSKVIELPYVGYDPDDFAVEVEKHDRFSMIYIGRFYGGDYSPEKFFVALSDCIKEGLVPKNRVQALFYGAIDEKYFKSASDLGLDGVVSHMGNLSHKELIPALKACHTGVWIMGSEKSYDTNIPSKIFDYVGAGLPVMALLPEGGEAARFIREAGIGQVADTSSAESIKLVIRDMYLLYSEGKLGMDDRLSGTFSANTTHEEYWKLIGSYLGQS